LIGPLQEVGIGKVQTLQIDPYPSLPCIGNMHVSNIPLPVSSFLKIPSREKEIWIFLFLIPETLNSKKIL
jgi:hypothetical protein